MYSGEALGDPGLGQAEEPARQLPTPCHTVESGPGPLTRFGNTHTLWMPQFPGQGGGRGPEFQSPSSLLSAPRAGQVREWTEDPPGLLHPTLTSRRPDRQAWEVECLGG